MGKMHSEKNSGIVSLEYAFLEPTCDFMRKNNQRYIYLTIGWIFTGLGFVGAFLPLLPTVPFLLIAVWAFSKSSPRLKRWLFAHPKFGPHLENWFKEGAVSTKAKCLSVTVMGISVGFSVLWSETIYIPITLAVIMVATATFILTRPSPSTVAIKSQ